MNNTKVGPQGHLDPAAYKIDIVGYSFYYYLEIEISLYELEEKVFGK
ncbi:hypothetical protein R4Z09_20905 [Niallia oryzisoli]|uniref:Maturase K n=1 Tax=Niallia oryzisoli TaxID=1737571 RepID=A0ABZ2CD14_9BACI